MELTKNVSHSFVKYKTHAVQNIFIFNLVVVFAFIVCYITPMKKKKRKKILKVNLCLSVTISQSPLSTVLDIYI